MLDNNDDNDDSGSLRFSKRSTKEAINVTGTSLREEIVSSTSQSNDNASENEEPTSDSVCSYKEPKKRSKGKKKKKVGKKTKPKETMAQWNSLFSDFSILALI